MFDRRGRVFGMGDEEKAKKWIGEDIWDMILSDVEAGTIRATQMRDLAYGLSKSAGGAHDGRMSPPEVSRVYADRMKWSESSVAGTQSVVFISCRPSKPSAGSWKSARTVMLASDLLQVNCVILQYSTQALLAMATASATIQLTRMQRRQGS